MSQFIYRIQPVRQNMLAAGLTDEEEAVIGEHFDYLNRLNKEGVVILAGRTLNNDETSFGIVIFEPCGEQEARSIMEDDPSVKKGVMNAELYPYKIALQREPGRV